MDAVIPNYGENYGADALFTPAVAVVEQGDGLPDVPPPECSVNPAAQSSCFYTDLEQ